MVRGEDLRIWATLHPLTEGDENAAMFQPSLCRTGGCAFTTKVLLSSAATNCALSWALSAEAARQWPPPISTGLETARPGSRRERQSAAQGAG